MKFFTITGHVRVEGCPSCGSHLRVEAWDADRLRDDFVGSATTDSKGWFRIQFSEEHYRGLFQECQPDLYFRIYRGNRLLKSTEKDILWNHPQQTLQVEIPLAKSQIGPCCDDRPALASQPRGAMERFIPADRFALLGKAVETVTTSKERREKMLAVLNRMKRTSSRLDLMLTDARRWLRGSKQAGSRLTRLLETLAASYPSMPRAEAPERPGNVKPVSLAREIPQPPGLGLYNPCLFPPGAWIDIDLSLDLFEEINPEEWDRVNRYRDVLWREVWGLQPLETIYQAAVAVLEGEDWANDYFEASILGYGDLIETRPIASQPPLPAQPKPISLGLNQGLPERPFSWRDLPFPQIDFCRAQRADETGRVARCWTLRENTPAYVISGIRNLTAGDAADTTDGALLACVGHIIQLEGEGFGDSGQVSFGVIPAPTSSSDPTLVWGENAVTFEIPAGAVGQELLLRFDLPDPDCQPLGRREGEGSLAPRLIVLDAIDLDTPAGQLELRAVAGRRLEAVEVVDSDPPTVDFFAEACQGFIVLHVDIRWATSVSIERGLVRFADLDWSPASSPLPWVRADSVIPNTSVSDRFQIFRVIASNLCNTQEKILRLNLRFLIHAEPAEPRLVFGGDPFTLTLRTSCAAPSGGTLLSLEGDGERLEFPPDVFLPEGASATTISLRGRRVGSTSLRVTSSLEAYEPLRIAIVVAPRLFTTSLAAWINDRMTLEGDGFENPAVALFPAFERGTVRVECMVESATRLTVTVPENAISGSLRLEVGSIPSDPVALFINDPRIDTVSTPLRLGESATMTGRGFSSTNTYNTIRFLNASGSPLVEVTAESVNIPVGGGPSALTFPVPENPLLYATGYILLVVGSDERSARESDPFPVRIPRMAGSFNRVDFTPVGRSCGSISVTVEESSEVPFGTSTVQVYPFTVSRVSRGSMGDWFDDQFTIGGSIGGLLLSDCCTHVAVLSYWGGAFEPSTPSSFNLRIFSRFHLGREPVLNVTVWSTSGSGEPEGSIEPHLWFSPDCSIVAIASRFSGGRNGVFFYDLAVPEGTDPTPLGGTSEGYPVMGFRAEVQAPSGLNQRITYTIQEYSTGSLGERELPIP